MELRKTDKHRAMGGRCRLSRRDACFSGDSGGGGVLIDASSPVYVEAALPEAAGGWLSVVTAGTAGAFHAEVSGSPPRAACATRCSPTHGHPQPEPTIEHPAVAGAQGAGHAA